MSRPTNTDKATLPDPGLAEALAREASMVLERVFERLETVAVAVLRTRPPMGQTWTEAHLAPVVPLLQGVSEANPLVLGAGFVGAPGVIDNRPRFMAWWQHQGERTVRLRLNFDPGSVDIYDYLEMDWYQEARDGHSRTAYGPYVDYSGSDLYTVTTAMALYADGTFLGVVGADLVVAELERNLVAVLRRSPVGAIIVDSGRRVIATNTARRSVGTRIEQATSWAEDDGLNAAALPAGIGWTLILDSLRTADASTRTS